MKTTKTVFVGGTFDENGGRPSSVAKKIYSALATRSLVSTLEDFHYFNGGNMADLEKILSEVHDADYVFWFPDVTDNEQPKLVKEIKTINPKCILVTSKRNQGKYSVADLIQHALGNKSNLLLEFNKNEETGMVSVRILDPLGNLIFDWSNDLVALSLHMADRVKFLKSVHRVGTVRVGDAVEVPDESEFFELVRTSAEQFAKLLPVPSENHRFLGNASFRCRHGFPSFRKDGMIFVSRRNVDKEVIGKEGFVALNPNRLPVEYYGDYKPSVDAPVQVMLYQNLPKINYMVHGHVYLRNMSSPLSIHMTARNIPCGGLGEVEEVMETIMVSRRGIDYSNCESFAINLKGHGCLFGFAYKDQFQNFMRTIENRFKARIFPERI